MLYFDFEKARSLFKRYTQEQVDSIAAIMDAINEYGSISHKQAAYILATAYHETAHTMLPVREGMTKTDDEARRILGRWRDTKPKSWAVHKYLKAVGDYGHWYYGRGYVQITWMDNYKRFAKLLGIDLYQYPDLALKPDTAAKILVIGMMQGLFSSKKLSDYVNEKTCDYLRARKVVNGTDQAARIAQYAKTFDGYLIAECRP